MGRTGTRTRIAEGVYKDNLGLAASVKVGHKTKEKRFPFGTDLRVIKAWRESARVKLRPHALLVIRGTFSAEAQRYLRTVKGSLDPATFKGRRSEIRAWTKQCGAERVHRIDQSTILAAIGEWRSDGRSAKTIQNRVRTLAHLWKTLYAADAPLAGIELPKPPKRRPTFVAPETIVNVEATLRAHEQDGSRPKYKGARLHDSRQRARFMVMATCGMRPAQLKRMTPADVDLERRIAFIPSAKGGEPVSLYLNSEMLAAWQTFSQAHAWGHFDTRAYGRAIRAAGWPAGVRPYNARHAVGIELGERGVDFRTIADFLGHTHDTTTRAFYVPVLNSRLREASELLDGRLGWQAPKAGTVKRKRKSRSKTRRRTAS